MAFTFDLDKIDHLNDMCFDPEGTMDMSEENK